MQVIVAPDVLMQELEEEIVLLDLNGGRYFGLDEVGAVVWRELSASGDVEAAVEAVYTEYDVDEATVRQDVHDLVQELLDAGLVTKAEG